MSFSLPYIVLPNEQVNVITANPNQEILKWIKSNDSVKFFIHPDMLEVHKQFSERDKRISNAMKGKVNAKPTSSTRTMVINVEHLPEFMIKADLEKVISRFVREFDKTRVKFSIEICNALQEATSNPLSPSSYGFLPETIGSWLEFPDGHSIGYVIRELNPLPIIYKDESFIPFFSLFSPNMINPKSELLIYQIIDNIMRKKKITDPSDALLQYIFKPCLDSWAYLVYNFGILPERHAQNCLLSLDSDGIPIRIIDRDLQGFTVDLTIREDRKLSTDFCHHIVARGKRSENLSLCYDHRMGFQIFDPILEAIEKRYGGNTRIRTQEGIKKIFYEMTPSEFLKLFPKQQYGLDNTTMYRSCPSFNVVKSELPRYR